MNLRSAIAVSLLVIIALCTSTIESISEEEREAYAQVNLVLEEHAQRNKEVSSANHPTRILRSTLSDISKYEAKIESSKSGEIRGAMVDLMRKLIKLDDLIGDQRDSELFLKIKEEIAGNLCEFAKKGEALSELEEFFVILVSTFEANTANKSDQESEGFWAKLWRKITG